MNTFYWNDEIQKGLIRKGNSIVNILTKPTFSFEYINIHIELPKIRTIISSSGQRDMLQTEVTEVLTWIEQQDINVKKGFVVDSSGFFKGYLALSEMSEGDVQVDINPPSNSYIYNFTDRAWDFCFGVLADGSFVTEIDDPKKLVILFTLKTPTEELPPNGNYKWDFTNKIWYDSRNIEKVKLQLIERYRSVNETRIKKDVAYAKMTEMETWRIQLEEARGYKNDPTYPTPFIDRVISLTGDDKLTFVNDIIQNNEDFILMYADYHADLLLKLREIKNAKTLAKLDEIASSFQYPSV